MEVRDRLIQRGHDVVCVSTEGETLYSYFWYTLYDIRKKMPKDADVYHALTPMEAMWLPKGKGVVTFHDLFQITHPNRLGSGLGEKGLKHDLGVAYFKYAMRRAINNEKIAAVSDTTKEDVANYLKVDPTRISVIRSGIQPNLDIEEPADNNFLRLGYLGQLDRRKRVALLILAVLESKEDWQVQIAGTGPEEARLKRLAQNDSRIHFLGRIPDTQLSSFYNSIDVLVFPTWIEGYGLPIVEAMACGRPVVVMKDAVLPYDVGLGCAIAPNLNGVLKRRQALQTLLSVVDF
jgi:glycosyltransferase involved in cell wall biosynthesis